MHSDIGGGYDQLKPGAEDLEHGNRNNRLSRHYLKQMHSRAIACGVPFKDAPAGEFKNQWSHGEALSSSINALLTQYKNQPGLRVKHAILREAAHMEEVVSDELESTPKRANKRRNPRYRQLKSKLKNMRELGIPLLNSVFLQDAFDENEQDRKDFLSSYAKFNKGYIHVSHVPVNDGIGMDAQITTSLVNTKVWPALAGTAYTSLIKKTVKREIFYNKLRR